MPIRVSIDDTDFKRDLLHLIRSLEQGFEPTLKEIGDKIAASVGTNFEVGGRPEAFAPLADSTKRRRASLRRRSGGAVPVAGDDDPLLETGVFRDLATNTKKGMTGSAYVLDGTQVVVGVDLRKAFYPAWATGTADGSNLPVRNPLILQEGEAAEYERMLEDEVDRRLRQLG